MAYKRIPNNYDSMSGKVRNIVEAVVFDGIYVGILYLIGLPFKTNVYLGLLLIPITVFSLVGIGGQSLTTYVFNYIRFVRRKRVLGKPTQEYIREKNRAVMLKKQKELRGRKENRLGNE